ncbi:MAG: SprB repeat-containing protein, partial [Flavobacteriales bacterium]|nr:SprB repeat-containing protein [Flavobacteriales bacterium]
MKHITLFTATFFLLGQALAQCNAELSIDEYVAGGNTVSNSFELAGNLQFVDIELNWSGGGSSWPADLAIVIEAPNGQCVAWWGWQPTGIPPGCNNLGDVWPGNWTTTQWGNYSFFINTSGNPSLPSNLSGSGAWTISFTNTWSQWADYDMDITLGGVCAGECFDPMACNFVPDATIPYNDLCEYAIDWYPSGLYDCDGNCYLDFDGDGICNALEIAGCQEEWACNYNPNATDPPLAGQPCVYPDNDDVDCDGNSLLPQFLTQPQNATVSCSSVPVAPVISAQPAPAALIYHGLFPVDCYDDNDEVDIQYSETLFAGSCPGNYTIDRFWLITDCHGHQNSMLQTITVVDNLPPVVLTNLDADTLDCNDPVVFEPLIAQDACGGTVTVVGEPSFVSLPGSCDGESVEKKYTTIKDQCGNQTTVQQVLVIEDNDAPFWLNEPDEQIVTNNLDGEVFDVPVADDICSDFEVNMTSTYQDGLCPLSVVLTRTFVATDQCGNTSAPFIQTITEATDLTADVDFTSVSCHDGNDGTAQVTYEGGVAPYTVDWGGYNPSALPAGSYTVEVNDANLCGMEMEFLITEPSPFTLDLEATVPECNDPMSGSIAADINGGSGNVSLDWGGINPNSVEAGTYSVTATDALGCEAMATVVVPLADIPESLELTGNDEVVQGDSAAYYYEYTLGSSYN